MVGIHNYEQRFKRTVERIQNSSEISEDNKKAIFRFKDYLLSEGIGLAKIERYLGDMPKFNRMLGKSFESANKEDIRRVVSEIHQTDLSEQTKRSFKIMIRKLYVFLRGIEEKGVYPDEVRWMKMEIKNNHKKLPEELLTEEEIKKIIRNASNSRDKAFLASLAESGCRISEIGLMKIKHVTFESYGARIFVSGKTGSRKVLIISATPYLQDWINNHPDNDNPESYLWITTSKTLLTYNRLTAIVKNASRRAGIKKRVHAHLFRHSRATHLASIMSDSQLKNYLGWTQSSKMAGIYVHMSGKDADDAVLKANNIQVEAVKKDPVMKPIKCLKCKMVNPATNKFCNSCGFVLDSQTAENVLKEESKETQASDILTKLLQDKDVLELIQKKMGAIQNAS